MSKTLAINNVANAAKMSSAVSAQIAPKTAVNGGLAFPKGLPSMIDPISQPILEKAKFYQSDSDTYSVPEFDVPDYVVMGSVKSQQEMAAPRLVDPFIPAMPLTRLSGFRDSFIDLARTQSAEQVSAPAVSASQGQECGCETCQTRTCQDVSSDAGVTFQAPTGIPASTSGVAVAAHEGQHVTRETADAQADGAIVAQKKVTLQTDNCPDCGKTYIAGGKTSITTIKKPNPSLTVQSGKQMMGALGDEADVYI